MAGCSGTDARTLYSRSQNSRVYFIVGLFACQVGWGRLSVEWTHLDADAATR
jgi:hypothetical protein